MKPAGSRAFKSHGCSDTSSERAFSSEEHCEDRRHGRARKYTFTDVVVLRAINRMLQLGARPARFKTVISTIGRLAGLDSDRHEAQALVTRMGVCLFVTDSEALIVEDDESVIDLLHGGQLAFGFVIDLRSTVTPVCIAMDDYRSKRSGNWKLDWAVLDEICLASGI